MRHSAGCFCAASESAGATCSGAWALGRSPRLGADLDVHAIHVFRGSTDERESWEDCKAHIARFLPCGDDVVVVRDSDGCIQSAHTRRHAVVFSTLLGTARFNNRQAERDCRGRVQVVVVVLPGGSIDMGNLRAGMTGPRDRYDRRARLRAAARADRDALHCIK